MADVPMQMTIARNGTDRLRPVNRQSRRNGHVQGWIAFLILSIAIERMNPLAEAAS